MTNIEVMEGRLAAAQALSQVRRQGGVVLRVVAAGAWRLYVVNGRGVANELKFRLLELQPFVMILLRELAQGEKDSQVG